MERKNTGGVQTYRDLVAWQKAMELTEHIYEVTKSFPKDERFGLTAQMRRSAVSIPSNIAEGFGRSHSRDFKRFLQIAKGSLFEFQTQAELARRMKWLGGQSCTAIRELSQRVDALLTGLIRSIGKGKPSAPPNP